MYVQSCKNAAVHVAEKVVGMIHKEDSLFSANCVSSLNSHDNGFTIEKQLQTYHTFVYCKVYR